MNCLPVRSVQDLIEIGTIYAQAKIGGAQNPSEGLLMAITCHMEGISPARFMEIYHIQQGKLSKRADAMLADFVRHGGDYKIISRSPDRAAIWMKIDGREQTYELTWEVAKEEPFVYDGGPKAQLAELKKEFSKRNLKNKYATPHSRMQMLWARVVSDSVRSLDAGANQGCYTPEEIEDFAGEVQTEAAPVTEKPVNPDALQKTVAPEQQTPEPEKTPEKADTSKPTPFDRAEEMEKETDYTICPIGKVKGKGWHELSDKVLEQALKVKHADMTDKHREVINRILDVRKNSKTKTGDKK